MSTQVALCWPCADVHSTGSPCPLGLAALQSGREDYFVLFGLPPCLNLGLDDLRDRFYERSRRLHPDRFAQRSADELVAATRGSAALNHGYRTLRDPLARAAYRLEQVTSSGASREVRPDPDLLMELMETEELLDEARGVSPLPESLRASLVAAQSEYQQRVTALDTTLTDWFAQHDRWVEQQGLGPSSVASQADQALPDPIVEGLRRNLGVRKYYRNILRNLAEVLDP